MKNSSWISDKKSEMSFTHLDIHFLSRVKQIKNYKLNLSDALDSENRFHTSSYYLVSEMSNNWIEIWLKERSRSRAVCSVDVHRSEKQNKIFGYSEANQQSPHFIECNECCNKQDYP